MATPTEAIERITAWRNAALDIGVPALTLREFIWLCDIAEAAQRVLIAKHEAEPK